MKQRVPVAQIMSKDLVVLTPTQSLYDAERLFNKHNIRHIPVVESERIVGVISRSDLLRISYSNLTADEESVESLIYDSYTIPQVMTRIPVTISSDRTVKEAAEILSQHSFHSIPVVDGERLVGIITTTDLLNYLLEQY
ncbi:MAG: CBS domain-containing protein [Weeksellaceae bacterium]|jgi:CBS domain-containing protein|nr:CBS domain-containing protein [Weeksellaceae bacterium]